MEYMMRTSKFKKGDKVRVVRKGCLYTTCWVEGMNKTVGEIGTCIDFFKSDIKVRLKSDFWWYPADCLELTNNQLYLFS